MLATKELADFDVEYLGIESPSYFQGFGGAFTDFAFATYGIGDTEEEAMANCMDSMAQSGDFEFTEENEKAIRAAYGPCGETTVADELGWTEEEEEEVNESGEGCYFHIGIRWNEKEAE